MSREELIQKYFHENYSYEEIRNLLKKHGIHTSYRHLQRLIQLLGLRRKLIAEDIDSILEVISKELEGIGSCIGYKSMWLRLKHQYGLSVYRSTVQKVISLLDPVGVEIRSKYRLKRREYSVPGPNFLWHMDGYDKLKPFGFAIHGCVDGFSRKILWLEVSITNNKPEVICHYYLKTVNKLKVIPSLMRSDNGSENVIVETVQQAFRTRHTDELSGINSFIKGKSTANQRIESTWRRIRQHSIDFWIGFFKDMRNCGHFDKSNPMQVECLRFCFSHLIQGDLDRTRKEWNRHNIRKQRGEKVKAGKPNYLYYVPEAYGVENHGFEVLEEHIANAWNNFAELPKLYSYEFCQLAKLLLPNVRMPSNVEKAFKLYHLILEKLAELEI